VVDHVVPLKDGGARFDRANLQPLCVSCHNRKTARETAGRR
jgi:5-methylcytosine-specific restriction enzyme A